MVCTSKLSRELVTILEYLLLVSFLSLFHTNVMPAGNFLMMCLKYRTAGLSGSLSLEMPMGFQSEH
jgi:hypothetical protein